jgi:hypothetical protein
MHVHSSRKPYWNLNNLFMTLQYVLYLGEHKRAMDEYTFEIFMGRQSTIVLHSPFCFPAEIC